MVDSATEKTSTTAGKRNNDATFEENHLVEKDQEDGPSAKKLKPSPTSSEDGGDRGTAGEVKVAREEKSVANSLPCPSESSSSADDDEDDLQLVFDEILPKRFQRRLRNELKVTCVGDILKLKDELRKGKVDILPNDAQNKLLTFCLWYENFHQNHAAVEDGGNGNTNRRDPSRSWQEALNDGESLDVFEENMTKNGNSPNKAVVPLLNIKVVFDSAVRMLHDGDQRELAAMFPDQTIMDDLYNYCVQKTIECLPEGLIDTCQFDVKKMIYSWAKAIFNLPTGKPYPKIQVVAGRTQSGKSNVKAVVLATCGVLRCPLIIITKGVKESLDLSAKIYGLLNEGKTEFDRWWGDKGNENQCMVIPDTAARINNKAIRNIEDFRKFKPHGKFVVIVDESDAMYRTDERGQMMEQAYDKLMDMDPALRIEVSATPIPTLLFLTEMNHKVDILELGTSEDYSSVSEMIPLKGNGGKGIFLPNKALKHNDGVKYTHIKNTSLVKCATKLLFPEDDRNVKTREVEERRFSKALRGQKFIPFTSDEAMLLYEDALSQDASSSRKGVLLLDCTNNRVSAENNIFIKAACIQNHFFAKGKLLAVVIFVGDGIYVRRPGHLHGQKVNNQKTVSEVLDRLDQDLGLDMPIFVFAYSKMRRCISYRSELRVPTHMLLSLGDFQSNESYIQALGRATFNGLETVLKANGIPHVTILTTRNDLAMAQLYANFVHEVSERVKCDKSAGGKSLEHILADSAKKFKDSSNYLRFTNRKTGQIKRLKTLLPDQDQFEAPEDCDDIDFGANDVSPRILRAVYDLLKESIVVYPKTMIDGKHLTDEVIDFATSIEDSDDDAAAEADEDDEVGRYNSMLEETNKRGFSEKQIRSKYNDTYQDDGHTIKAALLTKTLNQLKSEARLEKTDDGKWRAKNVKALEMTLKNIEEEACDVEETSPPTMVQT